MTDETALSPDGHPKELRKIVTPFGQFFVPKEFTEKEGLWMWDGKNNSTALFIPQLGE